MEPRMERYHLTEDECLEMLEGCECGVVCTNGADGYPYGTPVNYVVIDGRIFFHGRMRGTRTSNMLRDPRCSMTVMEERGYQCYGGNACDTDTLFRSVIVYGRLSAVDDPDLKSAVLRRLTDRLVPSRASDPVDPERVARTGVYAIDVESLTGKYRDRKPGSTIHPVGSR